MLNFKPIEPIDYSSLIPFFSEQPHNLSIYSPASIIAWSNPLVRSSYAIWDGICFIANESEQDTGIRHLILPVSGKRFFSPAELSYYAQVLGYQKYCFVPEDYLAHYDRSAWDEQFNIQEQNGFSDYIYRTQDLAELPGNKYSKKRNLINQFLRTYVFYNRVLVAPIQKEDVSDCQVFLDRWCEERACSQEEQSSLACERMALITTLQSLTLFESMSILVRIDGTVSALGIGSRLNKSMATLNFEKALGKIKGLYQYLDNECAKRLFHEFIFINKESDMNLQSLGESKLSYHPIQRLNSYELTLRS